MYNIIVLNTETNKTRKLISTPNKKDVVKTIEGYFHRLGVRENQIAMLDSDKKTYRASFIHPISKVTGIISISKIK